MEYTKEEWIPQAIEQKNPRLTLALAYSVSLSLSSRHIDKALNSRWLMPCVDYEPISKN